MESLRRSCGFCKRCCAPRYRASYNPDRRTPNWRLVPAPGYDREPRPAAINPDAAGSGLPDIPLGVDLHAIGDAGPRIAVEIDQQPAVGEHAIGLDVIGANEAFAAAGGIEDFLVGGGGGGGGVG